MQAAAAKALPLILVLRGLTTVTRGGSKEGQGMPPVKILPFAPPNVAPSEAHDTGIKTKNNFCSCRPISSYSRSNSYSLNCHGGAMVVFHNSAEQQ